jgi:hypothetical protein
VQRRKVEAEEERQIAWGSWSQVDGAVNGTSLHSVWARLVALMAGVVFLGASMAVL